MPLEYPEADEEHARNSTVSSTCLPMLCRREPGVHCQGSGKRKVSSGSRTDKAGESLGLILRDNPDCSEREQGRSGARPCKANDRPGLGKKVGLSEKKKKQQNSQGNLTTGEWKYCFKAMPPMHTSPSWEELPGL